MKKFMYLLVATAIFVGCAKKEDDPSDPNVNSDGGITEIIVDNTLTIRNVESAPGTSIVDEVALVSEFAGILVRVSWNGSTAKINLPSSVSRTESVSSGFSKLTVSDGDARFVIAEFSGLKSGILNETYSFVCRDKQNKDNAMYLLYTDRDLTIKGQIPDGAMYSYDLSLKKGWNMVWRDSSDKSNVLQSTKIPKQGHWVYEKYRL